MSIGALAQTLGSTLLLRKCVDQSYLETTDQIVRWTPAYPETETTVGELLSHTAPDKTFHYAPSRLSALTGVIQECASAKYPQLLGQELFDLLAMINSVPGQTLNTPTADDVAMFEPGRLARYADILRRVAIPYRVINRRPVRNTDVAPTQIDFAQGVVSSALDLAQFDMAYDNGFLAPATRVHALSQAFANGKPLRTGLGWFVQAYNDEPIAWQFGVVENAYSSLDRESAQPATHADPPRQQRRVDGAVRARGWRCDDVHLRQDLPASLLALNRTAPAATIATLLLVVLCGSPREARAATICSCRSSVAPSLARRCFPLVSSRARIRRT